MGRYVILLIAPVVIGVLIAATVVLISGLRARRIDARRTSLETSHPDGALSSAHAAGKEASPHPTNRRIAS
jgi:hypothetical protein